MKYIMILLLLLCSDVMAQETIKDNQYTCPMHPEVQSGEPGKCPKCGMELEKKEPRKQTTKHPDSHTPGKMDRGNNASYKPFHHFAAPVLNPTAPDTPILVGNLSNLEKDIETKPAEAAAAGLHLPPGSKGAKTVRYDLYVADTVVNYTGKKRKAIAINGSIAAPTLVFTLGDTAVIYVHNKGHEPTALHWHGVQLPERMDGVPYLTQQPIAPNTTYVYKFVVVQDGTYWYHSHFSLQEQSGLYGALIFNKRTEPEIPTIPLVLSDWSDMKPSEIDRSLHAANDWFAIRKKAAQSYSEAIKANHLGTKLTNEWKRMKSMDVSDVYYEKLFANGASAIDFSQFKAGDKVRLRVINGSASTYFWLTWSGGKITVIANDGNDVEPVEVDRLIVSVSETYDVIVTIPDDMKYEFLATAEDRTNYTSVWLGKGMEMPATKLPRLKYFEGMKMMNSMMKMNGDMNPMGMQMSLQKMDMNRVMYQEVEPTKMEGHNMKQTVTPSVALMHPEIISSEEGKCPKCGMQLEKKEHANHTDMDSDGMYSCPMHPEVISNKEGKCPKCGMDLEKKEHAADIKMDKDGMVTLNYNMLRSTERTVLPDSPWRELKFELTGNMNRYVWTLDNKTVSESDKILIRKGENLRIVLYNNSMMRHPMHLHGHDFRVLNQHGDYAPLKNVLDIMPMETDTLEFAATESGEWFFHCHILYHMMSGMGRVFRYQDSPPNPEIPHPAMAYKHLKMDDRMFHFMGEVSVESNGSDGRLMLGNTRWLATSLWHLGYHDMHGYESETMIGRFLGKMQWWYPYVGFDYHYKMEGGPKNIFGNEDKNWFGQTSNKLGRKTVIAGIAYTLPWLVIADARVDGNGKFRLQFSREDIPVTPRLRLNWMINSDKEYMLGFRYIISRYFNLSTHYDSDMGLGAGITITY